MSSYNRPLRDSDRYAVAVLFALIAVLAGWGACSAFASEDGNWLMGAFGAAFAIVFAAMAHHVAKHVPRPSTQRERDVALGLAALFACGSIGIALLADGTAMKRARIVVLALLMIAYIAYRWRQARRQIRERVARGGSVEGPNDWL